MNAFDADVRGALAVGALVAVTVLTRGFFLLSAREPRLPAWVWRGLRHTPVAGLCAMVAPQIFLEAGPWSGDWRSARLPAATAALAWHLARPRDITGTILAGTATLLALRLGLGWH